MIIISRVERIRTSHSLARAWHFPGWARASEWPLEVCQAFPMRVTGPDLLHPDNKYTFCAWLLPFWRSWFLNRILAPGQIIHSSLTIRHFHPLLSAYSLRHTPDIKYIYIYQYLHITQQSRWSLQVKDLISPNLMARPSSSPAWPWPELKQPSKPRCTGSENMSGFCFRFS